MPCASQAVSTEDSIYYLSLSLLLLLVYYNTPSVPMNMQFSHPEKSVIVNFD
jgi:hypothetical protein